MKEEEGSSKFFQRKSGKPGNLTAELRLWERAPDAPSPRKLDLCPFNSQNSWNFLRMLSSEVV